MKCLLLDCILCNNIKMKMLDIEDMGRIVELPESEFRARIDNLSNLDKETVVVSRRASVFVRNSTYMSPIFLPDWGTFTPPMPKPYARPLSLAGFLGDVADEE